MLSNLSFSVFIFLTFSSNKLYLSTPTTPSLKPCSVKRMSALSSLSLSLYSALLVNILYGSVTPCVTKSSISTPIYDSYLPGVQDVLPCVNREALMPAIIPCAAASS